VIKVQSAAEKAVSLRRAIEDLEADHRDAYAGEKFLAELKSLEAEADSGQREQRLDALHRRALLANPALDFESILLVRRRLGSPRDRTSMGAAIGMTAGNFSSMWNARKTLPSEIVRLNSFKDDQSPTSCELIYQHERNRLISDIDLHFDGERIMFSSVNAKGAFRLYEIGVEGGPAKQLTPDRDGDDVDHFDSCYLPGGDVIFTSTASFCGMPCIDGKPRMSSIYRLSPETGKIRQLSFDQDSSWCPTVSNDGRVLYLRWEYRNLVDTHHSSRPGS
jgi:hypothetical protein